jgi:hypothetical protein
MAVNSNTIDASFQYSKHKVRNEKKVRQCINTRIQDIRECINTRTRYIFFKRIFFFFFIYKNECQFMYAMHV